jgi:hypothetical protein
MSDPSDRKSSKTSRRWAELLRLQEQQRLWAEDATRRLRAQREELLRQWFARHLETTNPQPGQPPDTLLGEHYGDLNLTKRTKKMATLSLAVSSLQPLRDGGHLLTAKGTVGTSLRSAFRKLVKRSLTQMANRELPPAGAILDATVDATGMATISARVVDATVAAKVRQNVYPLVQVTHTRNEILGVDLVDTDGLSKVSSNLQVIVKLFEGASMSPKKAAKLARQFPPNTIQKAAPPNSDAASTVLTRAPLIPDAGDPERRQLHQQAAIELIKAARLRGPIADERLRMTAGLR